MDSPLKQRLIGAAVLAALAIIFLPMLLKGPDVKEPDAAEVPLSMPAQPAGDFETRELPLTTPEESTPPGGVLGMPKGAAPAPASTANAVPEDAVPSATPDEAAVSEAKPATPTAAATPAAGKPATPVPAPAAVAPAPATPAEAARVGAGDIVVNVGSFGNAASANSLASKLRAAGLPVLAEKVQIASGPATRLRVGPFSSRAAAEAARLKSDAISGSASKVIVLDAPAPVAAATPAKPAPVPVKPAPTAPKTAAIASKPAAAAPAPSAPKPAASASGFAVQLSAPAVEAEANVLRDRARAAGFSSFVQKIETDKGTRYRVRVGPVADRGAAETLRDAVNGKLGTGGIVVANP